MNLDWVGGGLTGADLGGGMKWVASHPPRNIIHIKYNGQSLYQKSLYINNQIYSQNNNEPVSFA